MSGQRIALEVLRVDEPCTASWDEMRGDGRVRFCGHCRKHVHDLSAMPRDEAERLVCEQAGSLCVRFTRAADGAVLTLDYQRPGGVVRTWRFWTVIVAFAGLAAAVANALGLGAFTKPQQPIIVMGSPPPITAPVMGGACPAPRGTAAPPAPGEEPADEPNAAPVGAP